MREQAEKKEDTYAIIPRGTITSNAADGREAEHKPAKQA